MDKDHRFMIIEVFLKHVSDPTEVLREKTSSAYPKTTYGKSRIKIIVNLSYLSPDASVIEENLKNLENVRT